MMLSNHSKFQIHRCLKSNWIAFIILFSLNLTSTNLGAQAERPASARSSDSIVYHGKLVRPDGSPIDGSLTVTVRITSPEPSQCLLWSETQIVAAKSGGFSIEVGYAENRISGPAGGGASSFRDVFLNNPGLSINSSDCAVGSSYVPSYSDDRLMSARFLDAGNTVAVEKIPIKSVPFAKQAQEISGYGIANLFKISGNGSAVVFSTNEAAALKTFAESQPPSLGASNQILGINTAGNALEYKSITAGSGISVSHSGGAVTINATGGGGLGSVTDVSVSGLPLSVSHGSTTPRISIAQAGSSQAGFLSSVDWVIFNNKQPAGNYLTAITAAQVNSALGFTPQTPLGFSPISNTLANGQVFVGDGSNVASARLLRVSDLRSTSGAGNDAFLAAGGACSAGSQLGYNSVTDKLECAVFSLTSGQVSSALGYTPADSAHAVFTAGLLNGGNTGAVIAGSDSANSLTLETNNLARVTIASDGKVGVGTTSPGYTFEVRNDTATADFALVSAIKPTFRVINDSGRQTQITTFGSATGIRYGVSGANQSNYYANGDSVAIENAGTGPTYLIVGGSIRQTISGGGNVGIGTTSPGDKLDVLGKVRATHICAPDGSNCKDLSSSWSSGGTVSAVSAAALPLSVTNGTSTPQISIAQASGAANGYLSSADWTAFNNKQPAGSYLTSISSSNVNAALGYTPLSPSLAANQVLMGNGGNVAEAGFLGIGQLRNNVGTLQFPSSCAANQTLTWSAVTDVLSCSSIASLPASAIGSGTIDSARLPYGASLWLDGGSGRTYYNGGNVGIGVTSPSTALAVNGTTTSTKFQVSGTTSSSWAHVGAPIISADTSVYSYGRICAGNGNGACTSPGGVVLEGSGSNTYGNVYISGAGTSFFNGGNVGIGTMSPSSALEVSGFAKASGLGIGISPTSTYPLYLFGSSNSMVASRIQNNSNGASSAVRQYLTADVAGAALDVYSSGATGNWGGVPYANRAFLSATSGGTGISFLASDSAGYMTWHTGGNGERMRIDSSGRVGIGTTSPAARLEVNGEIKLGNTSTTCNSAVEGQQRYNSTSKVMEFCNGTAWTSMSGGSAAIAPPIGSIIAWHKSLANTPALPSGWLECNGQTVTDASSPYNGQAVPNLNSQVYGGGKGYYLRGGSTSGAFNGSTAWDDNGSSYTTTVNTPYYGGLFGMYRDTESGDRLNYDTAVLDPNTYRFQVAAMTVVWIIRIK